MTKVIVVFLVNDKGDSGLFLANGKSGVGLLGFQALLKSGFSPYSLSRFAASPNF